MTEITLPSNNRPTLRRGLAGRISPFLFRLAGRAGHYIRWSTATMWRSIRLLGYAVMESLTMVWFGTWLVLSVLGWRRAVPPFEEFRRNTARQRTWAEQLDGIPTKQAYGTVSSSVLGPELLQVEITDPARARDLDWHLVNPAVTFVTAGIPLAVGAGGVLTGLYCAAATGANWIDYARWGYLEGIFYDFVWMLGEPMFWILGSLIFTTALGGPLLARLLQRLHANWVRFMLSAPGAEVQLQERVETLTQTRKTALELQTAEIQRIERDLHDGAQARLVTMGMTLTQVSRLMRIDPDAAETMLAAAKDDSAHALRELRTLVRGIRPPVLADRGLSDALRSLAAGLPIETTIVSDLSRRPVAAVESALYFAISELLANAVKHSAASEIRVELGEAADLLIAAVTDNGIGGAEHQEQLGGGLDGVRRRLEPFDGTLQILSPVGGGTTATIRMPQPAGEQRR